MRARSTLLTLAAGQFGVVTRRQALAAGLSSADFARRRGLPRPEAQVTLGPYRVDFLWRASRVVVETNDFASHAALGSSPA